jgi:hypothetical protein
VIGLQVMLILLSKTRIFDHLSRHAW